MLTHELDKDPFVLQSTPSPNCSPPLYPSNPPTHYQTPPIQLIPLSGLSAEPQLYYCSPQAQFFQQQPSPVYQHSSQSYHTSHSPGEYQLQSRQYSQYNSPSPSPPQPYRAHQPQQKPHSSILSILKSTQPNQPNQPNQPIQSRFIPEPDFDPENAPALWT